MPFRFIFFVSSGNEGEKQKINSLDSGMRRNDGNFSLLPRLDHAPPRICRTP